MKKYSLTVNGKQFDVKVIEAGPDQVRVAVNGEEISVDINEIATEGVPVLSAQTENRTSTQAASAKNQQSDSRHLSPDSDSVTSPIPGQIIRILVREGDRVTVGQKLLVLEAMKLENKIVAHKDGLVKKVLVRDGDTVSQGQQLVQIQ